MCVRITTDAPIELPNIATSLRLGRGFMHLQNLIMPVRTENRARSPSVAYQKILQMLFSQCNRSCKPLALQNLTCLVLWAGWSAAANFTCSVHVPLQKNRLLAVDITCSLRVFLQKNRILLNTAKKHAQFRGHPNSSLVSAQYDNNHHTAGGPQTLCCKLSVDKKSSWPQRLAFVTSRQCSCNYLALGP